MVDALATTMILAVFIAVIGGLVWAVGNYINDTARWYHIFGFVPAAVVAWFLIYSSLVDGGVSS